MSGLDATLSLLDIRRALVRHWPKAAAFFALCMALVVAVAVIWPRRYVSEAQFFVKLGRPSVRLDPTATTGQTVSVNESRETEINSILEVLRSRALAERVVDDLGVETVLGGGESSDKSPGLLGWIAGIPGATMHRIKLWLHGIDHISEREAAVDEVVGMRSVAAPRRTNVIAIVCEADSPEMAEMVTASLLRQYQSEHVRVNMTQGSFEFFERETRRLADRLEDASRRVREAKNEQGLASVEGQRAVLQSQMDAIERDADATTVRMASIQAEIDALSKSIDELPERIVSREERGLANNAGDSMRSQLYGLELEERRLLASRTEDHPEVQAVRQQVSEARAILDEQPAERVQRSSELNPKREQLLLSLTRLKAERVGLQARQLELQGRRRKVVARIGELNTAEVRLDQLERDELLVEQSYRLYAEKLEQARTDQALDRERVSNINVFQPATFSKQPVSPRLGLLVVFGVASGVLGGIGIALLAECIDRSLKTAEEVERQLDLPVLVSIPRVTRDPVLLN